MVSSTQERQEKIIEYLNKNGAEVVYFPYTQGTSSSILREKVLNQK